MLALLASFFLLAYILVPGVIFRLVFSSIIPLKKFQRTRTQEMTFAVLTSLLPLVVASFVASLPWGDFQNLFDASLDNAWFAENREVFWASVVNSGKGQLPFLYWYYGSTVIWALLLGWLARVYGKWQDIWLYGWFTSTVLLPNVSEWYMLLEPFTEPGTRVMVDILTSDDHLYRGEVGDYFESIHSELTGILLVDALRFDREAYVQKKNSGTQASARDYWKTISGKKFYVAADKITTINISYEPLAESIDAMLKEFKIPATVSNSASEDDELNPEKSN